MKLLEVDEAANHIRELVDEDANIIWGSAFNPDLQGKIRVSVVATGIDGTGDVAMNQPRSFALGASRAPKRPVLELPAEDEFELPAEAEMAPAEAEAASAFDAPDDREPLGAMPGGFGGDDEAPSDEYDDDVDGIVDPLAGLRNDEADAFQAGAQGAAGEQGDDSDLWTNEGEPGDDEPLDLAAEAPATQDELLLDADRLAARDEPVKPMLGGGRAGDSGRTAARCRSAGRARRARQPAARRRTPPRAGVGRRRHGWWRWRRRRQRCGQHPVRADGQPFARRQSRDRGR
jgi:cell division protein FtsZ